MPAGIYLIGRLGPGAVNVGDHGYFGLSLEPEKRIDVHLGNPKCNPNESDIEVRASL